MPKCRARKLGREIRVAIHLTGSKERSMPIAMQSNAIQCPFIWYSAKKKKKGKGNGKGEQQNELTSLIKVLCTSIFGGKKACKHHQIDRLLIRGPIICIKVNTYRKIYTWVHWVLTKLFLWSMILKNNLRKWRRKNKVGKCLIKTSIYMLSWRNKHISLSFYWCNNL